MQAVSQVDTPNPNLTIPLDFETVQDLPDSHSWTVDVNNNASTDLESAPIIDLSDHNAVNTIRRASETWGIFHVINHGIPKQLLKELEFQVRRLFSLHMHEKLKATRSSSTGITGYGAPRISSFFGKRMWTEGFTIVGSPIEHARKLWPEDYIKFCDVMEEYQKEIEALSGRLMWLILNSFGISRDNVEWLHPTGVVEGSRHVLQLNSYPICPDPNRAMGLAQHTDASLLTVLYQSSGGLQVHRDGVGWVLMPPVDDALVVNVGDILHYLTNGRFVPVLHRSVPNKSSHRLSVAYFYGPPMHVPISPFNKLVDHDHPLLYRSMTWKEFLEVKAKHFNEALAMIRIA